MTILFCGDPHGRYKHIVSRALALDASAVILLGDLQPTRPLHDELADIADRVWFIHGNHDTDSDRDFEHVFEGRMSNRNLHGRVVTLPDGTTVAGLGGIFRESVWHPDVATGPRHRTRADLVAATPPADRWREGPSRRHWSTIFPEAIDALSDLRADVLVTHEAGAGHPHGMAIIDVGASFDTSTPAPSTVVSAPEFAISASRRCSMPPMPTAVHPPVSTTDCGDGRENAAGSTGMALLVKQHEMAAALGTFHVLNR